MRTHPHAATPAPIPWGVVELQLTAHDDHPSPYGAVDVWVDFRHPGGRTLRRPGFWDGDRTWRVRFASPGVSGEWTWRSGSSVPDAGLHGLTGRVVVEQVSPAASNRFLRHGFWTMSAGGRSLVHADGTPAVLVADTAWALPWRATLDEVRTYAADRKAKGFNAVLLMTVQPDMRAAGPRSRVVDQGFDVGFEDLSRGHLTDLRPDYFQYVDSILQILFEHEIVPVLQPVFHGFGWKGLDVAGPVVPPGEYARYCRYLVARYGAQPVVYLLGGDGTGREPQVAAGGAEVERCDAYHQPRGIHYRPHSTNRSHQDSSWLDFQWCQTGHRGEHVPERVTDMWRNTPVRAIANGEPTYEQSARADNAAGWWQGHEAWTNLCAGGTMGVVYGAASLWQWRRHPEEPGFEPFFLAPAAGWREALHFEGSRYVGLVAKLLDGLPTTDVGPDWLHGPARALFAADRLYLSYVEDGGPLRLLTDVGIPLPYRVIDPCSGATIEEGVREKGQLLIACTSEGPLVYICHAS
jgi:Protein of unknown function (DUF4038)/Domain of unknown function (DUF5060)